MEYMPLTLATIRSVMGITPEKVVHAVGLIQSDNPVDTALTPADRVEILRQMTGPVQRLKQQEQEEFYGEIAAKYLPALKAEFDKSEGPINPAMFVMNQFSAFPYFARFSKLPEAASLTPTHLKRLVDAPSQFGQADNMIDVAETCQFLATLFSLQGASGASAADKRALIGKLKQWKRTFRGKFAAETVGRCLDFLSGDREMVAMVNMVGMMLTASLTACGYPGCKRKRSVGGGEMIQCDRCKTAVYCSSSHKEGALPIHERKCFEATY